MKYVSVHTAPCGVYPASIQVFDPVKSKKRVSVGVGCWGHTIYTLEGKNTRGTINPKAGLLKVF